MNFAFCNCCEILMNHSFGSRDIKYKNINIVLELQELRNVDEVKISQRGSLPIYNLYISFTFALAIGMEFCRRKMAIKC